MPELMPGNVPLYEEHAARVEAHYTLPQWQCITPFERAFEVAHYRLRNLIQAHSAMKQEEEARKPDRKNRRK